MPKNDLDLHITVNGQPLSEFVGEEKAKEIEIVRVEVVSKIRRTIYYPQKQKTRSGTGRGPGKPKGIHKAKVYSKEEIDKINREGGVIPFRKVVK